MFINNYLYLLSMPTKLNLTCEEELWREVRKSKIDNGLLTMNDTVIFLIKRGLKK